METPVCIGQRVIVFDDAAEPGEGGVLGFHGTVVGVERDREVCAVELRVSRSIVRVPLPSVFVLGDTSAVVEGEATDGEIRFDGELVSEVDEVSGVYRLPGQEWTTFAFEKCDEPHFSFQLRIPGEPNVAHRARVNVTVPCSCSLTPTFVDRILSHFLAYRRGR